MNQVLLVELINEYIRETESPNLDVLTEIGNRLKQPDSIPVLLKSLTSEEIPDKLKRALLIFLQQSIQFNIPNNIDETVYSWIQMIFSLYEEEKNFQFLILIHHMLKIYIKALPKEDEILSIFMNMLSSVLEKGKIYHSILLAKTILNNFTITFTPENLQLFLSISLYIFQNFSKSFFDTKHSDEEIKDTIMLILKSKKILKHIMSFKKQEFEAIPDKSFNVNIYLSSHFIPIQTMMLIARLGIYTNAMTWNQYNKFWHFIAKSLSNFSEIKNALTNSETERNSELLQILIPQNFDLTTDIFTKFEDLYFICANHIFKNPEINEFIKSVPFSSISKYIFNFSIKRASIAAQYEIYLTYLETVKSVEDSHYQLIHKFNSIFKQYLLKHQDKKGVYEYFKDLLEKFMKKCPQNQLCSSITFLIYFSTAVKYIPTTVVNDISYIANAIDESFKSDEPAIIFHALKLLRNMLYIRSIEFFQLFYDCITNFLPKVQQLIFCGEVPLVDKALEIYSDYLNLSETCDIEFIIANADEIKEVSKQHYYQFMSLYFEKSGIHESEELEKYIKESLSMLEEPFIQMNLGELNIYLTIYDFLISILKNNERYFDAIWPIIHFHFNYFMSEVLPNLIDTEANKLNFEYFNDNWLYIYKISSSIASIANLFCSDLAKIYGNQENNVFLLECVSSVWTLVIYFLKEKNLNFYTKNEKECYLQQNIYSYEDYSQSLKLMSDQQLIEFTYQLHQIMENITYKNHFNYIYIIMLLNAIIPRLIESNDEKVYSVIEYSLYIFFNMIEVLLVHNENRYSNVPLIIEPIFEYLPKYCEKNPDNELSKNLLAKVYSKTSEFLLERVDTDHFDQLDPFHEISYNYFSYYNDMIEALISTTGYVDENKYWIDLYFKICEKYSDNYLFYALDTFIKAVQQKNLTDESVKEIALFAIKQLQEILEKPSPKLILTIQNIIFLFHRLVKVYENEMVLEFLKEEQNLKLIVELPQFFEEKNEDESQILCLKENIASLCLCLACNNFDIDTDFLVESIELFIPSDQSEIENFLVYFLYILNRDNKSSYFQSLNQPIFSSLITLFSKPFCTQLRYRIQDSLREQAVSLFLEILSEGKKGAIDFINEQLDDKPLDLFRINKFIQFYETSDHKIEGEES